jgi:NADH dehydrogenase [ubiquinone] 1 alpha subcomplex assembly factor 1
MAAMRRTIQAAISRGVPAFNSGDHMGCAMIYRACAADLLAKETLSGDAVAVLQSAVQDSQRGDATTSAWTLREALDWCLASGATHSDTARSASSSDDGQAAAAIVHEAISIGVPLFNGGEHAACADVYADAAQRIARLDVPAGTREQLMKARGSKGRPADRAWALRRALDTCIDATTRVVANGGGGARSGHADGPLVLAQPVDDGTGGPVVLAHPAAGTTLVDFTTGVSSDWRVVNDGVMGGVSRSNFAHAQSVSGGHAEFSGTLSFARNGGFASVRGKLPAGACAGATGVVLTVRGSRLPFKFCVRDRASWDSEGYQADFTPSDEWAEVRVPFSSFIPSRYGQVVGARGSLRPDGIISGGLMLSKLSADGQPNGVPEGQFRLEIRTVKTY